MALLFLSLQVEAGNGGERDAFLAENKIETFLIVKRATSTSFSEKPALPAATIEAGTGNGRKTEQSNGTSSPTKEETVGQRDTLQFAMEIKNKDGKVRTTLYRVKWERLYWLLGVRIKARVISCL